MQIWNEWILYDNENFVQFKDISYIKFFTNLALIIYFYVILPLMFHVRTNFLLVCFSFFR